MTEWTLHWLEAEGDLGPWRTQIEMGFERARAAVAAIVAPPRLDIVVQRMAGAVIPEIGMVGHAWRRSAFSLTLDPDNAHFERCLDDGTLPRHIAHEVHHCLRKGTNGYGLTLGEALVSEGLAGQFVRALFGNAPEPWECAVDAEAIERHIPTREALEQRRYDHSAWFFGTGALPRWLGYTLGYQIVGRWLDRTPNVDGPTWVEVPAATVLDTGLPPPLASCSTGDMGPNTPRSGAR